MDGFTARGESARTLGLDDSPHASDRPRPRLATSASSALDSEIFEIGKTRVLIVDDDAVERHKVRRALQHAAFNAGGEIYEAESASHALLLMKEFDWDCVLLDYCLPDATGIEVLTQMANAAGQVAVPIVMLTGIDDIDLAVEAMRRGARDYLVKDSGARYQALLAPVVQQVIRAERTYRTHRWAAVKLHEAELRYRGLVEQIPAVSYITSMSHPQQVLFISPQIRELGFEPDDILNDAELFWRHLHPDDEPAARETWNAIGVTTSSYDQKYRIRTPDGREVWLRDQARVVDDDEGGDSFIQGILTDVTEAKRTEAELQLHRDRLEDLVAVRTAALEAANRRLQQDIAVRRQIEQQLSERETMLQLALEAADVGAWEYDLRTRQMHFSRSRNKLYGLPADQISGPVEVFVDRVHPDDREQMVADFRKAATGGKERVELQFRVMGADGGTRHIASRIKLDRNAHAEPHRAIGVDVDVTTEHELQARLERSNQELERFAYTVAHDLKSPLQAIMGFAGLISRSAKTRLSDAEREQLGHVTAAAKQMGELIDGILQYARASQDKTVSSVDMDAALAQCMLRLLTEIERTGAIVTADPLPAVPGNTVLLTQVLQNLLANALKYCTDHTPRIHIGADRTGKGWIFSVRDNGIGIKREHQVRIFEAFQRAHSEANYAGLGLGLALVKGAIDQHGGQVWVESTPGEGSTFYFALPCDGQT